MQVLASLLAAVVLTAAAATAVRADVPRAEPPRAAERAAIEAAREANFESRASRQGFVIAVSAGPGFQASPGIDEATGLGGVVSVRLGRVATPRTVVMLEVATTVYKSDAGSEEEMLHQSTILGVSAQTYLQPSFWVRGGAGVAGFSRRESTLGRRLDSDLGVGALLGVGVEIVRRHSLALSLETFASAAYYGQGSVLSGAIALGLGIH
jgi:hypothetical protein